MLTRKCLRDFDLWIFVTTGLLLTLGATAIYSTTYMNHPGLFLRQITWIALGIAFGVLLFYIPFKFWNGFSYILYPLTIIALVIVLFWGRKGRWIDFGLFLFQPSELAKPATIFLLASILSDRKFDTQTVRSLAIPVIIVLVPFILVILEPDMGTSLVFAFILLVMLYAKGVKPIFILCLFSPVISLFTAFHWISWVAYLAFLILILYMFRVQLRESFPVFILNVIFGLINPIWWRHLRPYQRERILAFLSPSADPKGAGWQLLQSKIAIGSGGLFGKGILGGTQKSLAFIPAEHTDFIFASIGEELGFLGALLLFLLFFILATRALRIAREARSEFGSLVIVGIISYITFQIFVNIAMAMGILPVVGLPLPLIPYGGSSMLITLGMIGLILNIGKHKYEY
ncbi:MAG TPA: rod shape-determining protein RodA [bacterium (Candidatus Stahlbacteria)]|nr:rod shape-determining protein RodA [Candidatus Stahlbacteria bacterium]